VCTTLLLLAPVRSDGGALSDGGQSSATQLVDERQPHTDHRPRHGGHFFMAPDGFHHLEGALSEKGEFCLYFYDNFTDPIPARPFLSGARAAATRADEHGLQVGAPVQLRFALAEDDSRLEVELPSELETPLVVEVRLQFEGREAVDRFKFSFATPSARRDSGH
jgi:hypothetical protein